MKRMAIMRNVRFGLSAAGQVGLSFHAHLGDGLLAPIFLPFPLYLKFIDEYEVADVKELDGKAVWVRVVAYAVEVVGPCLV